MDSVKHYHPYNLDSPVRLERPASPDENNPSATSAGLTDNSASWTGAGRAVALLPDGADSPMQPWNTSGSGTFSPNIPPAANPSGSGAFESVSQTSAALVYEVTTKSDKPSMEDSWYQKGKESEILNDLQADKYYNHFFGTFIITRREMESIRWLARNKRKDEATKMLVDTLQKKYLNPDLCESTKNSKKMTKEDILKEIFIALGNGQSFMQSYLNPDYLKAHHPELLKSNTSSSSAQGSAPVDTRNAQYAAAGQRYVNTGQTKQAPSLKKGSGKNDINNKLCNVKESFPVQETSEPPSPKLPPRFFS